MPCPSRLVAYVQSNTEAEGIQSKAIDGRFRRASNASIPPGHIFHLASPRASVAARRPSRPELGVLLLTPASVTTVAMRTLVGWM